MEKIRSVEVFIVDLLDEPVALAFKGAGHEWYIMDKMSIKYLARARRKRDILPAFSLWAAVQQMANNAQ